MPTDDEQLNVRHLSIASSDWDRQITVPGHWDDLRGMVGLRYILDCCLRTWGEVKDGGADRFEGAPSIGKMG